MKIKLLRLLKLRTEQDFVNQRDYYQKEVADRIERFNKLVEDLSEDGVDVNKHLYSSEKLIKVSDWDTSKITDISNSFSDLSMTPFDIEKKNQQELKDVEE